MLSYVLKRLVTVLPTLLALVTLAFFLIRLSPGGPFDMERALPPEIEANLNARYHLDESLPRQYWRYLKNIAQGDFGPSFQYQDYSVTELIATGFPVSALLGGLALVLALLVGVGAGTFAATRQNSKSDHVTMALAMTGISIPKFLVAPMLVLLFAETLKWLPAGGWNNSHTVNQVMPVIALALPQIAYIARLMRGSMLEVLRAPYIRTARAKGLSERLVIFRHALKPALLPVVSYLGPTAAAIRTGSVVVEQIFGLPGIGRYFVQGALNRDYTLVLGVVVFYGALIILFNLLVDLFYAWLDPKVTLK